MNKDFSSVFRSLFGGGNLRDTAQSVRSEMKERKRSFKDARRLKSNKEVRMLNNYALRMMLSLIVIAIGDKRMKTRSVLR